MSLADNGDYPTLPGQNRGAISREVRRGPHCFRAGCGELIEQTTRTIAGDEGDTPGRHLDAHPSDDDVRPELCTPTDTVLRGDNLTPTPLTLRERVKARVREGGVTREQREAYVSLSVLAQRTPSDPPFDDAEDAGDDAGAPEPPAPLTLFPLPDLGCRSCGAAIAEGHVYCRSCDPRTA